MRYVVSAMLIVAAVIHLLPIAGVLGPERLATLYGIAVAGEDMSILLRHRAVVIALLGAFMLLAAFRPALQGVALTIGLVSASSFLWLAWSVGDYNAQMARVVAADVVASICLVIGAVTAYAINRRPASRGDAPAR